MTSLDDLRTDLERLADRGTARGASAVWEAARRDVGSSAPLRSVDPPRRGRVLALAGVVVVLVAGIAFAVLREGGDGSAERVETHLDPSADVVTSVVVRDPGEVRQVAIAFGRIWVATLHERPTSTTVRAYDEHTGELLGTVTAPGPSAPELAGDAVPMVATEHSLWVRTSTGGPALPAYDGADNVVYEIDPTTLQATPRAFLQGDGQLVGHGDLVAVADFSHLEVRREGGDRAWSLTTEQVVGADPGTSPGTNGLGWMRFSSDGLLVSHDGRALVVRLDGGTGRVLGRLALAEATGGPLPPERRVWWVPSSAGPSTVAGVVVEGDGLRIVRRAAPTGRNLLGELDDGVVLVDRPYALLEVGSGLLRPLDLPETEVAEVVGSGDEARIASWASPREGTTAVHLSGPVGDVLGPVVQGTFADGEPFAVRRDAVHGLCVGLAGTYLGCDDSGPVLPAGADPTTVRWGLDGDRWLAHGELPADAVDVVVEPLGDASPPGEAVVDPKLRLWAVPGDNPDHLFDVGRAYRVRYRMADGTLVDAPRVG